MVLTQQSALTQKLLQNTNYLQFGGMINGLYAVMTIFAQRFNFRYLQFKMWEDYGVYRPPGYTPGNSDWWPYAGA